MTLLKQSSFGLSASADTTAQPIGRAVVVKTNPVVTNFSGSVTQLSNGDVEILLDHPLDDFAGLVIIFSLKRPSVVCPLSSILDVRGRQVSIVVGQISISGFTGNVEFFGDHDVTSRYIYDPSATGCIPDTSDRVRH